MEPPDEGTGDRPRRVSEGIVVTREEDLLGLPTATLEAPNPALLPLFAAPRLPQHPDEQGQRRMTPLTPGRPQQLGLASRLPASVPAEVSPLGHTMAEARRKRGKKEGESGAKKRARKPADSPRRPKSAYMFFLAEFREEWKTTHPESKKVADVAKAAGEKWRSMSDTDKAGYEQLSTESKAQYAREMEVYRSTKARARPPAREEEMPFDAKAEKGGYHYFLRDFRVAYKKEHPNEQPDPMINAKQAADTWKSMTPEERIPFERMFQLYGPFPSGAAGESTEFHGHVSAPQSKPSIRPSLEGYGMPEIFPKPELPSGGQEASSRKDPMNPPRDTPPE